MYWMPLILDSCWRCTIEQAVRVATQYAPARCTPDAAAQLQPIPYACGAQRAFLPVAGGAVNIHDVRDRRQTDDRRRQTSIIA